MPKTLTAPTDVPLPEPGAAWTLEIHTGSPGVEIHVQAEGPKAEIGRQLVELGVRLQREAKERR